MNNSNTPTKSMARRQEETHWEEDQRRALAHSHMRTLHELESGNTDEPNSVASTSDPGTNISSSVPSISEQEQASRKRSFDNANNNDAQDGKSATLKGSPLTMSFRHIWGNADLRKTGDDDTVKSDAQDDSVTDSSRRFTRKRQYLALICMAVVVASVVTVAVMPSLRNSMQAGVSRMVTEGETVLAHGNKEQLMFPGGNLWTNAEGNVQMQVDGLYSPNNYPIADTLPVLWMMPQSGSEVVLDVLMYCLRLTAASGMGVIDQERQSLSVLTFTDNIAHYINVDTTTVAGLDRADSLSMVESGLADIMATPLLGYAAHLFAAKMKTGRVFGVLEHPVIRTMARFEHWRGLGLSANRSVTQYTESDMVEENMLTKVLANVTGVVTMEHVRIAKMMLERYVVIGLADRLEESLEYFYVYFGWDTDIGDWKSCQTNFVNHRKVPFADPDSDEYSTLADRNWADMEVYDYGKKLFEKRTKIHGRIIS